jgi:predicted short-subunit dehydrogenase-like oxidoreductase (DUF2520 family)
MKKQQLAFIGTGRVGTTLAYLARKAGYPISACYNRHALNRKIASEILGPSIAWVESAEAAAALGDVIFLTITDNAIAEMSALLHARAKFRPEAILVHCSGALNSAELLTGFTGKTNLNVASMHPLQAFPDPKTGIRKFPGSHCSIEGRSIEGSTDAIQFLEGFVRDLGGIPTHIKAEQKILYHAALVAASNFATSVMDFALELFEKAGLERSFALKAVQPLATANLENVFRLDTATALTGPFVRGDVGVIEKHREALREDPELLRLYEELAKRTCAVVERKQGVSEEVKVGLRGIWTDHHAPRGS